MTSLDEALKDLAGLGWVHWYVTDMEDYDDNDPDAFPEPGDIIPLHLYVETSAGLATDRTGEVFEHRDDVQKRLRSLVDWTYQGSGGFTKEIEPGPFLGDTPSAWTYPLPQPTAPKEP